MSLMIVEDDQGARPVLFCDLCAQPIADAKDGNYLWRMGDGTMPIWFLHKACTDDFERQAVKVDEMVQRVDGKHEAAMWGTMELQVLPVYLARNLTLDWDYANWLADKMGSMGR